MKNWITKGKFSGRPSNSLLAPTPLGITGHTRHQVVNGHASIDTSVLKQTGPQEDRSNTGIQEVPSGNYEPANPIGVESTQVSKSDLLNKSTNMDDNKPLTTTTFLEVIKSKEYAETVSKIILPFLQPLQDEIKTLKQTMKQKTEEMSKMKKQMQEQEIRIIALEDKLLQHDHQERLSNLRFSGLSSDLEVSKKTIIDIANQKMNLNLTKTDFQLKIQPKKLNAKSDPTPAEAKQGQQDKGKSNPTTNTVIVTFNNIWQRRTIYANRFRAGKGVFITEDLTKDQQKLAYLCRQAKRSSQIKNTWTFNNHIFVLTTNEEKIEVKRESDLQDIISEDKDKLDTSLTEFKGFTPQEVELASQKASSAAEMLASFLKK